MLDFKPVRTLPEGFELLERIRPMRPRIVLMLPNLVVLPEVGGRFFRFWARPNNRLEISCRIANTGTRDSPPFWVMTTLTHNGQVQPPIFARHSGLAVNKVERLVLAEVDALAGGESLCVSVWLDPPTPNRPGGEVWELNEEDNVARTCIFLPPSEPDFPRSPDDFDERPDKPEFP